MKTYTFEEVIERLERDKPDGLVHHRPKDNILVRSIEKKENPAGVKVGDYYEDCSYEPMQCVGVRTSWAAMFPETVIEMYGRIPGDAVQQDGLVYLIFGTTLQGRSLVNPKKTKAECSASSCGVVKLTKKRAERYAESGNPEYPGGQEKSHWLSK